MNLINGQDPSIIAKNELLDFMSNKTGLDKKNLNLIIEAFNFFLKKELLEKGKVSIYHMGSFVIKPYGIKTKVCKTTRFFHDIKFVPTDFFKLILKDKKEIPLEKFAVKKDFLNFFQNLFGINLKDAKFLFGLYFFCIITYLKKYNECRIPRFGKIILKERLENLNSFFSKKYKNNIINTKQVVFIMNESTFNELNKKFKQFHTSLRFKRMLFLCGIDRSVNLQKIGAKNLYVTKKKN